MENITIYPVELEDVAEVLPYVLDFRRKLFPMLDPNQVPADLQVFEQVYVLDNVGTFLQARTKDGILIGVIGMLKYDYRFPYLDIDEKNTVEVARLFVDPQYRRTGLGTVLFQRLLAIAQEKQIVRLYLHTHPFLDGAYEFWLHQGFRLMEFRDESGFLTIHMELLVNEGKTAAVLNDMTRASSLLSGFDDRSKGLW